MTDTKVYQRTENGAMSEVSVKDAMAEVNFAMMDGKRYVREMSSGRGQHRIEYTDGRVVVLLEMNAPAKPETDSEGRKIVTVKGKRYIVSPVTPARPKIAGVPTWVPEAYVNYWSERNGETFGATRSASASRKPGTVGRAIWDSVS